MTRDAPVRHFRNAFCFQSLASSHSSFIGTLPATVRGIVPSTQLGHIHNGPYQLHRPRTAALAARRPTRFLQIALKRVVPPHFPEPVPPRCSTWHYCLLQQLRAQYFYIVLVHDARRRATHPITPLPIDSRWRHSVAIQGPNYRESSFPP